MISATGSSPALENTCWVIAAITGVSRPKLPNPTVLIWLLVWDVCLEPVISANQSGSRTHSKERGHKANRWNNWKSSQTLNDCCTFCGLHDYSIGHDLPCPASSRRTKGDLPRFSMRAAIGQQNKSRHSHSPAEQCKAQKHRKHRIKMDLHRE